VLELLTDVLGDEEHGMFAVAEVSSAASRA
jgi:hypothetical protein